MNLVLKIALQHVGVHGLTTVLCSALGLVFRVEADPARGLVELLAHGRDVGGWLDQVVVGLFSDAGGEGRGNHGCHCSHVRP